MTCLQGDNISPRGLIPVKVIGEKKEVSTLHVNVSGLSTSLSMTVLCGSLDSTGEAAERASTRKYLNVKWTMLG